MAWVVETLNETVDEELDELNESQKAKFIKIVELIEKHGLENVGKPHVAPLEKKLWEIRVKGKDGIARALYVTAKSKRVVVVRAFVKKTQKTPKKEIELALKRAKEIT